MEKTLPAVSDSVYGSFPSTRHGRHGGAGAVLTDLGPQKPND